MSAPAHAIPRQPDTTFAGLAHLISPAWELADHSALIETIDRMAGDSASHDDLRKDVRALMEETLRTGRAKVREALLAKPHAGLRAARGDTHLMDCVVAAITREDGSVVIPGGEDELVAGEQAVLFVLEKVVDDVLGLAGIRRE